MTRFLLKRLRLALVTLFLLSVIVFALSPVLPGPVGRSALAPLAPQDSADAPTQPPPPPPPRCTPSPRAALPSASGTGPGWGAYGFGDFLEVKARIGADAA